MVFSVNKDENENSEHNLDKTTNMLTINKPCHILLYVVGNVIIAINGVLNFLIDAFLYWTPLSQSYVNY